jgi:hypothetical protein
MPTPADIQTANGGTTAGRAEGGDTVTFTFAGPVAPALVLAGWTGAAAPVTVHFDHEGARSTLGVEDATGDVITALGSVDLAAHYANAVDFAGSTMTASGNTIAVVLGTPSIGGLHTISIPTMMTWTAPNGSASESGPPDVEF